MAIVSKSVSVSMWQWRYSYNGFRFTAVFAAVLDGGFVFFLCPSRGTLRYEMIRYFQILTLISNFRRVLNVVCFWVIPRRLNSDAGESPKRKHTKSLLASQPQSCLGAFAKFCEERLLASPCVSACLSVLSPARPSVRHGTTRLPLNGYSWNSIFECF